MARGLPDYKKSSSEYTQALSDIAEGAARLNGINTFNRQGQVLFQDDFSKGLTGWITNNSGSSKIFPSTVYGMQSGISLCYKTLSGISSQLYIQKNFTLVTKGKYGVEFLFYPLYDNVNIPTQTSLKCYYFYEDKYYQYIYTINYASNFLRVYGTLNGVTGWHTVLTFDYPLYKIAAANIYNYCKIVMDFSNYLYNKVTVNDATINISNIKPLCFTSTYNNHLQVAIGHTNNSLNNYLYVTNFILTYDEP